MSSRSNSSYLENVFIKYDQTQVSDHISYLHNKHYKNIGIAKSRFFVVLEIFLGFLKHAKSPISSYQMLTI